MQEPDDLGARHQIHPGLAQGGQGVARDPQRIGPLQDGAQESDLCRGSGAPLVQEVAWAHGDDDGVGLRGPGALGRVQGGDVDEVLAQDRPQPPQLRRAHLAQPQALPVLDSQRQRVPQRPAVLVGGQELLGAGDVGELGHLGDVEARQVTDPVDDRHRPQNLGVQDVTSDDGQLGDGAQGHQVHHGGTGGGSVFGH